MISSHRTSLERETAISTTQPRVALVGGGGSGIGRATAEALFAAGHQVVLSGRGEQRLIEAAREIEKAGAGREVGCVVADLADPASAQRAVAEVERQYGAIDVLVINAGGPPPGRITEIDDDGWRSGSELLLLGPLRLARLVLPGMARRGFGRVIVVTSTAVRQPQPDLAVSVVLRAAVTAAAKLLSREFAADGVTVNCVAPGATATDRRAQILAGRAAASGLSPAEMERADAADVPAGRAGTPAEVAAAIAFLASPAASYVNGTVLTVDGGRTETI